MQINIVTDWVITAAWDGFPDRIYAHVAAFISDFLAEMGNMGAEIFDYPWISAMTEFFSKFRWALFAVGMVVSVFDTAIEYQGGRGSVKDTCMNIVKGFMAANLFTILPIELRLNKHLCKWK